MRRQAATGKRRGLVSVLRAWGLSCLVFLCWSVGARADGPAHADEPSALRSRTEEPRARDTSNVSCVDDHKRVQTARPSGAYLEARDAAQRCALAACPQLIREDCAAWYVDIEQSIPSVVFEVRDTHGRDLVGVEVHERSQKLNGAGAGRAITLDPGHHHLRFEAHGYHPHELDLVLREESQNRKVSVTLEAVQTEVPSVPAPRVESHRLRPSVVTFAALATVALGTYAALGITGKLAQNRLDTDCKPTCAPSEAEHVNRLYIAADVAAGVGVAAAITATILYFTSHREAATPAALGWNASYDGHQGALSLRAAF